MSQARCESANHRDQVTLPELAELLTDDPPIDCTTVDSSVDTSRAIAKLH